MSKRLEVFYKPAGQAAFVTTDVIQAIRFLDRLGVNNSADVVEAVRGQGTIKSTNVPDTCPSALSRSLQNSLTTAGSEGSRS